MQIRGFPFTLYSTNDTDASRVEMIEYETTPNADPLPWLLNNCTGSDDRVGANSSRF